MEALIYFFLLFFPPSCSHNPWLHSSCTSQWNHALRQGKCVSLDFAAAQSGGAFFSPQPFSPSLSSTHTVDSLCTPRCKCGVTLHVILAEKCRKNSSATESEPSKRWQQNAPCLILAHAEKLSQVKCNAHLLN